MGWETQTNHNPYFLASKEKVIVGLDKKKQDTLAEHFQNTSGKKKKSMKYMKLKPVRVIPFVAITDTHVEC